MGGRRMDDKLFKLKVWVEDRMCVFLRRLNARKTQMEDKATIEYLKVILFLLFVSSSVAAAAADDDDNDDDADAMAELAAWLPPAPPKWAPNLSSHYCTWGEGVLCDDSKRVISLYLIDAYLPGPLPTRFPYLPKLSALRLVNNSLSGSLPSLTNLPSLKILLLNQNKFTNITPEFFSGLPSRLLYFGIDDNPFLKPWKIPTQLTHFTGMAGFFAQNANVVGRIPDVFSSCTVQRLQLSYNNLSGSLPSSFGRSQIKELSLTQAGLIGTVDVLSSMFYLEIAHLEGNKFTGPIPKISFQTNLKELYLDDNQLTGVVPESLDGLQVVSLSRNKLQGPYPAKLNDTVEAYLNDNNFCTGNGEPCDPQVATLLQIASAFFYPLKLSVPWASNDACNNWSFVTCNLKREITTLDFRKQQLTGTISPSFANLTALQYLYLNDNNLMGVIPESLSKLPHLAVLDISNNNISGEIPKFSSSVQVVTAGNSLLGKNNSFSSPDEGRHQSSAKTSGERGLRTITIIALLLIWAAAGAVCVYWLWVKVAKVKGQKPKHGALYTDVYSRFTISEVFNKDRNRAVQLFTFEQLATATNNFSVTNELGRGGFGSVFKGILDTQEIAVKRLSRASAQGPKEFVNEALVMSKLQHRNLVRLLGVSIDREEKVLVYEYMPNKSLDAFLFDTEKKRLLGWRRRFNIIVGISRGLQYLHKDSRMLIIHRDLKASNILLDEDLNPKISDFGLAKVFDCSRDQANTRRVVGTYGYMPPEYAMEGRFSEKSDVFSFGVLILEVISGRRNASIGYNEHSLSLLEHAWKLWNDENISALVDPVISNSCIYEEIHRCTHVGLLCTQQSVTERPSISTVTLMLTSELDNLLPPKQPAFIERYAYASHSHSTMSISQVLMVDSQ